MSPEIAAALRILYGERVEITPEMLRRLEPAELKAVFRQRALELHPDRAAFLGRSPDELGENFKDVKLAYEQLRDIVRGSAAIQNSPRQDEGGPGDHYWQADIPGVRLLFGQFLYYAGLVTFNALVSAITWQRRQRPTFGRIARMWNYMTADEILNAIGSRSAGERFGDTALRLGYLSAHQRDAVMGFQKWIQRPIGEFFQEIGILEEKEIAYLLRLHKRHNARVESLAGF